MTRLLAWRGLWAVVLGFVSAASGCACGPSRECGPGTVLEGSVCVRVAGPDAGQSTTDAGSDADAGCVPNCAGRNCGDDGCGNTCGTCDTLAAPTCDTLRGVCVATCVPACSGRSCGADGCGGSCGDCENGSSCVEAGRCVPDAWTCDEAWYGAGDSCDCGCGVRDSDCDLGKPLSGCEAFQRCSAAGTCESSLPSGWTCDASSYSEGAACHCGCGAPDPDCAFDDLPIFGCVGDAPECRSDGTCATCVPDCSGKSCGGNGCGGTCGSCDEGEACSGGTCIDACSPSPVLCNTSECGDNGCGGSCGNCPSNATCQEGRCVTDPLPPDPRSCVGNCGSFAPAGCGCTSGCSVDGTCCTDFAAACSCVPNCAGKTCGSDGCGGTCGSCSGATPHCGPNQTCTASCTPRCDGKTCGADGCGGTCGTCGAGSTCAWTGQCVPSAWRCSVASYDDDQGCDCGCGAPDPDCTAGAFVLNCPTSSTTCSAAGLCAVTFCDANASCGNDWCTGVYYRGDGRFGGTCAPPDANAFGIGLPCRSNGECATGVCAAGLCREYCASDANCPGGQRCIGVGLRDSASLPVKGFVGVCEALPGTAATCTSQASCTNETCSAQVDPVTLRPRYLCTGGTAAIGASCAVGACPAGQTCATVGGAAVCTRPCPAGNADCPSGWRCGSAPFHNAGTSDPADDPTVPVCVRN